MRTVYKKMIKRGMTEDLGNPGLGHLITILSNVIFNLLNLLLIFSSIKWVYVYLP